MSPGPVLFAVLLLIAALLYWRLFHLSRLMRRMETELAALAGARVLEGPDVEALLAPEHPALITIEILNPFELAQRESRLASTVGALAPGLVRQEVLRQAVQRVRDDLQAQGVQAEVRLVRSR